MIPTMSKLDESAERVAMSIRTGSNGEMVAEVSRESGRRYVHVGLRGQERGKKSLGRIALFMKGDEPYVDLGELSRDFKPEVVEHIARGMKLPMAELRGRDDARFILGNCKEVALVSDLADAALRAGTLVAPKYPKTEAPEADLEAFVRGLLAQAEQQRPGLGAKVRAKLGEDKVIRTSDKLGWLARGAGLEHTPKGKSGHATSGRYRKGSKVKA